MTAQTIIEKYIKFFEEKDHKKIPNSPLVPQNDPSTLFISAGMQPLIPYLLGDPHPQGNKLVNVQNIFRAQDIDEVGDNRHTTFFRMLGNWSLGDYFKEQEIKYLWDFLTSELKLPKDKLYITVYKGSDDVPYDSESEKIWKEIFDKENIEPKIFSDETNWWSRSGPPENMPIDEPGGLDTEVYYKFDDPPDGEAGFEHDKCGGDDPTKCECGKFLEIANSVFIQYKKTDKGLVELDQKNVDFGGGLERILAAVENKSDIFQTSLFSPIIKSIEQATEKVYIGNEKAFQIVTDHLRSAVYITNSGVIPSNKEQGYILRRLLRRSIDSLHSLGGKDFPKIIEAIVEVASKTDPELKINFEKILNTILTEEQGYKRTLGEAKKLINKKYKIGDELKGVTKISAADAFLLYSTHGLSPTQIKSLGFTFDDLDFADKMEEHAKVSRKGADKKFAGGLADANEQTIRGHTATHLLHKAIRDMLGKGVYQKGSNITVERVRFDFNYNQKLTDMQIKDLQDSVNEKIEENLEVFYEFMSLKKARDIGAIGIFDEKYEGEVKIYMIGSSDPKIAYSIEFCGGPHVAFTSDIKSFKIIKQENIGNGLRRLYSKVG